MNKARGYSLFSGGLDSMLAVAVLRRQGCDVRPLVFISPFFDGASARRAARHLGLELKEVDFTQDILELVANPPHGFGGGMNPCIDCHARMIRRAGELMRADGLDFVSTGEVVNQRPMSQTPRSLATVAHDSGLEGRLLRPLCAKLLEPTIPEQEGLIDREQLYDFHGRTRKPQMALAAELGITEYPAPAGGCLLTEKGYCRKLSDLKAHDGLVDLDHIRLLKVGRHFRLPDGTKAIVGRNRMDNQSLKTAAKPSDTLLWTVNVPGPTAYVPGGLKSLPDLNLLGGICAGYGDHRGRKTILVHLQTPQGACDKEFAPLSIEQIQQHLIA
ncbi:MAG: tRNA 4-thiouridine(8) synthase ThiI [Kiritimatiellia bacterium]